MRFERDCGSSGLFDPTRCSSDDPRALGQILGALGVAIAVVRRASKTESLPDIAKASLKKASDARKKRASLGGLARAAKLPQRERRMIARKGGLANAAKRREEKAKQSRKARRQATPRRVSRA